MNPNTLLFVLTKIQKYILTQKFKLAEKLSSLPVQSRLGVVALAAFSSGNEVVVKLLSKLNFQSAIEEVYMFDAPYNPKHGVLTGQQWIDATLKWSKQQHNAVVRVYSQTRYPNLSELLKHARFVDAPILSKSTDGRRSIVYMSDRGWMMLFGKFLIGLSPALKKELGIPPQYHDPPKIGEFFMKGRTVAFGQPFYNLKHAWFSAMMLTDALRRSRFS
jgi:hypothetical protein